MKKTKLAVLTFIALFPSPALASLSLGLVQWGLVSVDKSSL